MTDVHFLRPTTARGALGKRALGLVNLHLLGRAHHFDAAGVVPTVVADALEQEPELFVMTGDLTALAQVPEFEDALAAFGPLLRSVPSVVVPGNHDTYTRGAIADARMERFFGPWMAGGAWDGEGWGRALPGGQAVQWPASFRIGGTTVIGTNPCKAGLRADGSFAPGAIERAERLIAAARERGDQVVYLLHYPPVLGDGRPYRREGHALSDVDQLLASLDRQPPDLILHGHRHEYWQTALQAGGRAIPVVNCGTSSAVSPLPMRTAGYNVYELEGGELVSTRRRILLAGQVAMVDHAA